MRTHYCGRVDESSIGKSVTVAGWAHRRRDHGGVIFVDLRDREGLLQVVFDPDRADVFAMAERVRNEFVLKVTGLVRARPPGTANANLKSGQIEVLCQELEILNRSEPLPFQLDETVSEEVRLRFRYLDLRREQMRERLLLRHRITQAMRHYLDEAGFVDIETPILSKATPEGARDYLVPSRTHAGKFFALPQSPQIYKQLLMISGFDRYYQIVRCFRDEDFRADRQAEFTQLDLEMSFPQQEQVFEVIEALIQRVCEVVGVHAKGPFRHLDYKDALRRYGSDKPDLRFGMELHNVTQFFEAGREKLQIEGNVQAVVAPGAASWSRKQLDELGEFAKSAGARGVYTVKVAAEGVTSPLEKTLGPETLKKLAETLGAKPGDLIVAAAAKEQIEHNDTSLNMAGQIRLYLGDKLNLIDRSKWEFAW